MGDRRSAGFDDEVSTTRGDRKITLMFVGDLMLSPPDASSYFDHVRPILRTADLGVAHIEWPHTERGQVSAVNIPAPGAPPSSLDAVAECAVAIGTMAGNHVFDQGQFGVEDTIAGLRARGVEPVGAGLNLDEARRPVIVERGGLTIGVLSYNAVGPRESWATAVKAGAAYVRVHAHYELEDPSPGSPPTEHTFVDGESLAAMQHDIESLAAEVDIVSVSLHKGMGFVHARLASYERPLATVAVDAGADIVVGHHAHILRGVEVYKGKPIFHGINHFVAAYTPESGPTNPAAKRPRPRRVPGLDLVEPDPDVPNYPFPHDSRHTMIATVSVTAAGVVEAGFVPCWTNTNGQPVPLTDESAAADTVAYVERITRDAGLEATFTWRDGHVVFHSHDRVAV